jgi:transglutaminase-like putative cysteine protease
VTLLRPIPRRVARTLSLVVLLAWIVTMALVLTRAYLQARSMNLAADLARYGTSAEWRGVYYRGEKIGFSVSQTVPKGDGFQMEEDARLQMALLGATTPAIVKTTAVLDRDFAVTTFDFSLDPGTGPVQVSGRVAGRHLTLTIKTVSGTQTEERDLRDVPVLSLNLPRRLAADGLKAGTREQVMVFDPATLSNQPATIEIGRREIVKLESPLPVRLGSRQFNRMTSTSIPAFRVEMSFAGIKTTSWVTDTGDVVREESQMGLVSQREPEEVARRMAVGRGMQIDLLEASAIAPANTTRLRIDDPRNVRALRLRIEGVDLSNPEMNGAGQSVDGDVVEVRDARTLTPAPADPDAGRYLAPEPLIESDDPAIHAEAQAAILNIKDPRTEAERLTRRVNAMLDKKPTVGLPSAREVLRTKVGDCNEHTALYVAMARSIGLPARIAVGVVYAYGAFYYHAWPEVYIDDGRGLGLWLPVDPTFNQFPADATHVRFARGGLDKQAAILPLIGRMKMTIVGLDLAPNSTPILVGRGSTGLSPVPVSFPVRAGMTCWSSSLGGAAPLRGSPTRSLAGPQ